MSKEDSFGAEPTVTVEITVTVKCQVPEMNCKGEAIAAEIDILEALHKLGYAEPKIRAVMY